MHSVVQRRQQKYKNISKSSQISSDSLPNWQSWRGAAEITLANLLNFWTGADQIPPGGFETKLFVEFYSMEPKIIRYLSAHTCSLTSLLPRGIGEPLEFKQLMETALTGCQRFGIYINLNIIVNIVKLILKLA